MDEPNSIEIRMTPDAPSVEVKKDENGRTVIRGYAAVYDSDSQDLGGFIERIAPGAFDEVLRSNPDVFGRYNHDRLLGRTSSGTVRLYPDERGLRYEIDPKPADSDLLQSLERGDVRGSSFAFRTTGKKERWYKDDKGRMIRELRGFDYIGDVGPVDSPAYLSTESYVSKRALEIARGELSPSESPAMPEPEDEEIEDPMLAEESTDARSNETVVETAEADDPTEDREVNLKPTAGMASAAKRGLKLHEEGKSGDGLKPETVARANRLARREEMNRDWVVEMNAWFKRHEASKTAGWDKAPDYSPAFVAHLLWGGTAAKNFSARKVAELERAGERSLDECDEQRAEGDSSQSTPAPKKDQIKGSDKNKEGSAKNASGKISVSDATRKALRTKVSEHNESMKSAGKPRHTRTSVGQLLAVYRRGAGAYSTSHRPGVSRGAWAMARVNAYLYLLRNGRPKDSKYTTDNDLLPSGHPKSSRKRSVDQEVETAAMPQDYRGKIASLKSSILRTTLHGE